MTARTVSALTIALLIACAPAAQATSIILSQTHSDTFAQGVGGSFEQSVSILSWTQIDAYSNVAITAFLNGNDPAYSGTAYLMTRIGPGATAADEVAHQTFAAIGDFAYHNITLFTGLTLPADSYYLLLWAPLNTRSSIAWGGTAHGTATFTRAPGVTGGAGYDLAFGPSLYPPNEVFFPFTNNDLTYAVTGDVIPEPSSLIMLATGMTLLVRRARRRLPR
jgi:hypothetical protein